jgi:hypothetical protein
VATEHKESEHHEYTAALCVRSETLGLSELTDRLGAPSRGHDSGDAVSSRRPESGRRSEALWVIESSLDRKRPLDEHVEAMLAIIDSQLEVFAALRNACDIEIFCGLFAANDAQGGFSIEPELSARLAALSLPLVIDIY